MQCISRVHMSQAVLCEIVQLLVYKSKVVILIGVLGRAHDNTMDAQLLFPFLPNRIHAVIADLIASS